MPHQYFFHEDDEEIDMPTPCQKCGDMFDLNDGRESKNWFPNTTICPDCADDEDFEIEHEEEIKELTDQISDLKYDLNAAETRLQLLLNQK